MKNQEVASKVRLKKAKGDNNTKTLIIIYLKEYEKTRFSKESVNVPFINPSIEKISIEFELMDIFVLIVFISPENDICFPKRFSPKVLIANEILEFKSKIIVIIKNEKFIKIPKNN